jgi:hypothetical protein
MLCSLASAYSNSRHCPCPQIRSSALVLVSHTVGKLKEQTIKRGNCHGTVLASSRPTQSAQACWLVYDCACEQVLTYLNITHTAEHTSVQ